MQNNWKRFDRSDVRDQAPRFPVPVPVVVSSDQLALLSDEDLMLRHRHLEDDRHKVLNAGLDVRLWEDELAYVKREQQVRRERRTAHEQYVAGLDADYQHRPESSLPVADLDNSCFTMLPVNGFFARTESN